jgi:hypothetical protein
MDWLEVLKQIGIILGGTTIAVAAVAWLARTIVTHFLSKDVEKYKQQLQDAHARAIEQLRNDLKMQALEHEVRFRKMHERQAEIISEVYAGLRELHHACHSFVNPFDSVGEPDKEGKHKIVVETSRKFYDKFDPARLYLPPDISAQIDSFFEELAKITNDFARGLRDEKRGGESVDHWSKGWKAVDEKARPLFEQIRAEFQRIIGVTP